MSLLSPAIQDALENWLASQAALNGAAENTLLAYRGDLISFLGFISVHSGGAAGAKSLASVTLRDMRAWMAQERADGISARSLARRLSAVKAFFRWFAEREGVDPTAVLATRAPKFEKRLPRPLDPDAAREMLDTVELQTQESWVAARDVAVLTLLYGCGLRISEALGLNGRDLPLGQTLRIVGKGGKERMVPVLPVAREAVADYLRSCPHPMADDAPVFRGVRGGQAQLSHYPESSRTEQNAIGAACDRDASCVAP